MALFYQHNINETTRLGIWRIEEPEAFFFQKVSLQREITHPNKRLQHLAARWLLQYLFPDFPYDEITIADTRKPFLPGEQYHFSISHTGKYAAAIVSSGQRVGLDIELVSHKIAAISHKFLHDRDIYFMNESNLPDYSYLELLGFMWSAKESLFKWYSLGGIDFKENFQLDGPITETAGGEIQMPFLFKKELPIKLNIKAALFEEISLVLSWVAT